MVSSPSGSTSKTIISLREIIVLAVKAFLHVAQPLMMSKLFAAHIGSGVVLQMRASSDGAADVTEL